MMNKTKVLVSLTIVFLLILSLCCSACTELALPTQGLGYVLSEDGEGYFVKRTFEMGQVNHLVIPSRHEGLPVVGIAMRGFVGCSFRSVLLPNSIKYIDLGAFAGCSLASITIPNSVQLIDSHAFDGCSNLRNVKIGRNVATIGEQAFADTAIREIKIPASVTKIGQRPFWGCNDLKNINVASQNKNYKSIDGVLFSKDETVLIAYPIGRTETTYEVSSKVLKIDTYAFANCYNLTSINIKGMASLEQSAFYNCRNLVTVTMPLVQSLSYEVFAECISLTNVTIPLAVTVIPRFAFAGCTSLQTVYMEKIVRWICDYAFSGCGRIQIVYSGTMEEWDAIRKEPISIWDGTIIVCSDGTIQFDIW